MDTETTIADLKTQVEDFVKERDWAQFHTPKSLSMALAIEASELMDLFKWYSDDQCKDLMSQENMFGNASDELADVIIYSIAFANRNGIDISSAIHSKIKKNAAKYPADKFKGKF